MKNFLFVLVLTGAFACTKIDPWKKNSLNFNNIDSIIVKHHLPGPHNRVQIHKLTDAQIRSVVNAWNTSTSAGLWKYSSTFNMFVYFDDKTIRDFRVNNEHIKEFADVSYDLGDKKFFNKLLDIED